MASIEQFPPEESLKNVIEKAEEMDKGEGVSIELKGKKGQIKEGAEKMPEAQVEEADSQE